MAIYYFIMTLLWCLVLLILPIGVLTEVNRREKADDKWVNKKHRNRKDNHPSLPDFVVIRMTIDGHRLKLNLTKNRKEDYEVIPVFIGGKWDIEEWDHNSEEEFNVYSDKSKDASFTLVIKSYYGKRIIEYFGFFVYKQIKYSLIPKALHEKSPNQSEVVHILSLHGIDYVVYQDTDELQQPCSDVINKENDAVIPANTKRLGKSSRKSKSKKSKNRSRRVKRQINDLIIDLLVIIDNSLYVKWVLLGNESKNSAIENIRYYLAHVINGVNNVFDTLRNYRLSTTVISLYICKDKSRCMFTEESNVLKSGSNKIDMRQALSNFKEWIESNDEKLPPHDVAVAFTDYDDNPLEGVAYKGTVCTDSAQGVIHEKGHYNTITTTAHEIGHILGCDHDQDPKCPPKLHYLMSPIVSNNILENRDKFSQCSIDYITEKIEELNSKNSNCLDSSNRSTGKDENLKKRLRGKYPGQHFGPDQQCKHMFGSEYKYCSRGIDSHKTICNEMSCVKGKTCYRSHPLALDGTYCGDDMWCIAGKCVSGSPVRKTNRSNCLFGDVPNVFTFNTKPMQCKDIINNPEYCYDLDAWCCKTCNKIRRTKNISAKYCQYGERGMIIRMNNIPYGCDLVSKHKDLCDESVIKKNCCESCNKVLKAKKHA